MTRTHQQSFARPPRGWKSLLSGLLIASALAGPAEAQVYHWKNLAGKPGVQGTATGPAGSATFTYPSALALDAAGNLYVGEANRLCKITTQGEVLTLAGNGQTGDTDGVGTDARFGSIRGLAVDGTGTVYVADINNRTIAK